ncbi:hypothetical protein AAFF_G00220120 [Aldrovandia affinis]|uniref:PEHE domain-containing protein n=1 Tax=Aldrovandia affinis TaxID=143900 RepID=A0AAD7RG11_9TELE|nr:hypothetical protein AAFF_G00220120 [Aldrovandia affinis]
MAPALTDAPAEAHHIRFKLSPPSSTLSPGSVENNSNASNILISSNGAVKCKAIVSASEEQSLNFRGGSKKEEQLTETAPPGQAAAAESLKLQGVLIKQSVFKTHGILPNSYFTTTDFLPRKQQTLEVSGEQLKSLMNVSGQPVANGLAKKFAKPGADKDCMALVNGGRPLVDQDSQPQVPQEANPAVYKSVMPQQQPAGISCTVAINSKQPPPPTSATSTTPVTLPGGQLDLEPHSLVGEVEGLMEQSWIAVDGEGAGCSGQGTQVTSLAREQRPSFTSLDTEVRDRTLLSQSRQGEIEVRLRRLCKRLQVVQAKQVERHIHQQLVGFLQTTFSKLPSLDNLRQRSPAVLTRKAEAALWQAASDPAAEDGLGRFLKGGSVPSELEWLSLSGMANLRTAEGAFDSDATESSSGGETDVEEEELTRSDIEQRHLSLWRRAEGRYALERASIVSHWNWLQAHISDLEYRIRQQTDIYRQIRTNKGLIELGLSGVSVEDGVEVKAEAFGCQLTKGRGSEGAKGAASAHCPATDLGLWKGSGQGRLVNGITGLHPGLPDCGSSKSSDTEELAGKKQHLSPLLSLPDNTCTAARTRPILSCKKRRLVRPGMVANLNRKVQRISASCCGCDVNPLCATCGGRTVPSINLPYDHPLLERLSQFDPCVHPTLSFSDDVSMSLHLQRMMKSHWQNKPLQKLQPQKKLSLKHKISLSSRMQDPCSSSRDKHKFNNSLLTAVRLSHHKMRPDRQQLDNLLDASKLEGRSLCRGERGGQALTLGAYDKSHSRKRSREHYLNRTDANPKLFMDIGSPRSSLASLHTSTHSPLMRQLSTSSESSTPLGLNSQSAISTPQPIRRRRGESSFDINNIVIPMSVAATTRVEKLQYKEILTPSWREADIFAKPITVEDESVELEDLTDAAFSQLHLPCEEQERSRWTWMASAPAKRRGSRSYKPVDGRTTPLLGSTNPSTPPQPSPDTAHFHTLQDYGPVPSPPSPACPDLLSNPYTPGSRDSYRLHSSEDTRCSTPDFTFEEVVPQTVPPWERRSFPLAQDPALEPEEQSSPKSDQPRPGTPCIPASKTFCSKSESESGPASPLPDDSSKQKPPTA